jgi:Dehydrogenases with different specificities (related to short-chain alcohol dehydrogenases)
MSSITLPSVPRVRELDLIEKVAVVTGASRGIGRAIALNLASRGCSILGTATSDTGVAAISTSLSKEVTSHAFQATSRQRPASLKITAVVADIFSADCPSIISEEVNKSFNGRVDIFINNAGATGLGTIGEMDVNHIQQNLLANVQTPVMIVEEFVRQRLFQPNSRIVYISSIRSHFPWSEQLMYSAGKSAGESLCRTWAQAFGGKDERYSFMAGTTANSVSVGLTETESVTNLPPDLLKQLQDEAFPLQSMPRFGQPDDIADIVGLLCSSDARWITGCVVSASGGGIKIGSG